MSRHSDWYNLVPQSGQFVALPVLDRVFPQGLDRMSPTTRKRLVGGYEEWSEAVSGSTPAQALHNAWIDLVLSEGLDYDGRILLHGQKIPGALSVAVPEHGETIAPSFLLADPTDGDRTGRTRMPISVWSPAQELLEPPRDRKWVATPVDRMTFLCRATGHRLGLVTNGREWICVNAPAGKTSGHAVWSARYWAEEPVTLEAFHSLLGARRFFAVPEPDTLEGMLEESIEHQKEVTDKLGAQVLKAVEVLVRSLDRADREAGGRLLADVSPKELYEAVVTVMMRLVFLLCAEERDLLLLGDPAYDSNYAISTLAARLRSDADKIGIEVLERRHDAWPRLLATIRAVFGGIQHDNLRMPALGGSLFDPDRFPFLEGRKRDTSWLDTQCAPLPVDNRTVLHILESLQLLQDRKRKGGAQRLSFRALDVEQVGHVYEGLLEHKAVKVEEPTLGLIGKQNLEPEIPLSELDAAADNGSEALLALLSERTGKPGASIERTIAAEPASRTAEIIDWACGHDRELAGRIMPYHALLREDEWGHPMVFLPGSFMVTEGLERRKTGTHYTPRILTEEMVQETLEPLVYIGPAEGKPKAEWALRPPAELLDLKICDMAMGSAAFLVQVCRWLGDRLCEAWAEAESRGEAVLDDGSVVDDARGRDIIPTRLDEREVHARRLIAERCIYGVDINPMAVELAKMSIWLVTMSKGRPFGFLDHNLKCGDSLLGVTGIDQLLHFHLDPEKGRELHHSLFDIGSFVKPAIDRALEARRQLRQTRIIDIEDVRTIQALHEQSQETVKPIEAMADLLVGVAMANTGAKGGGLDKELVKAVHLIIQDLENRHAIGEAIDNKARTLLDEGCPEHLKPRHPFHWAVEFPEVFQRENVGFDAIVGNPPFLGGKRISTVLGTQFNSYLAALHIDASRNMDLCAHFFRRAFEMLRSKGNFGLLSVNTIAEGDTRQGGLEIILRDGGTIYSTHPNESWPGEAAVVTSRVHVHKGKWCAECRRSGERAFHISAFLSDREEWTPKRLAANANKSFQGSIVLGMGFTMPEAEALALIEKDPKNKDVLYPYLNGEDLNSHPEQKPSRWVINFWDWPEERAREYPAVFNLLRSRVYDERLEKSKNPSYKNIMQFWWQHWNVRPALYHAIGRGHLFEKHPEGWDPTYRQQEVLIKAQVSKTWAFSLVTNKCVYSHKIVAFSGDTILHKFLLDSSIHLSWVANYCSRLKTDMTYTPSDVLETFPLPSYDCISRDSSLAISEALDAARREIMSSERIGYTQLYNRFSDSEERSGAIMRLRELHLGLDHAAAEAYDLTDINLEHGFHTPSYLGEGGNIRFTISEKARLEILRRLLELNRERYEEEVRQGLHPAKKGKSR